MLCLQAYGVVLGVGGQGGVLGQEVAGVHLHSRLRAVDSEHAAAPLIGQIGDVSHGVGGGVVGDGRGVLVHHEAVVNTGLAAAINQGDDIS